MTYEQELEFWCEMADAAFALGYHDDELRALQAHNDLCWRAMLQEAA